MLAASDGEELRVAALRALREDLSTDEYHAMFGLPDNGRIERLNRIIAKLEQLEAEASLGAALEAL